MTPDPTKIIVPRRHGEVLIEPPLAEIATVPRLPCDKERDNIASIFNAADTFLRTSARDTLIKALNQHAESIGEPAPGISAEQTLILTGHQVEFYHPGVWAKVIAADELARRVPNARAIDLLVDHDLVDHLGFDVPAQSEDNSWRKEPEEFAPAQPLPAESLKAPGLAQFDEWDARLGAFPTVQTDALAFFLSSLRPTARELSPGVPSQREPYVRWMSRARTRFEKSMDLNVPHVPATMVCTGPAWDAFVSGWIGNAEKLTAVYNQHLAAYRHRQNIKSTHHPMPDLERSPDDAGRSTFELPFWIYKPGESRERLRIRIANGKAVIVFQNNEIDSADAIKNSQLRFRPRALSFTMFVRLFLADLFIHGIGGALYDQISDGILEDLFHSVPPYACVSAAWLLPLGTEIATDEDLAALMSRRHHVVHNPQLAIDPFTALKTDVAELIKARKETIEGLSGSVATNRNDPIARQHRRELFDHLHAVNRQLHEKSPRILQNLDKQLASAQRAVAQNKVLLWREWFFGLHTTESLNQLIETIRAS
jgi:hypothetical protein